MSSRVTIGQHSIYTRGLSIAVAASLVMAQLPAVARAAETTPSAAVGGLSVSSDPAGAAVYVDGKLAGQTPATMPSLSAGDHRVRVVKDGYLENGRIVSVVAGQSKALDVKLTKYTGSATASSAAATSGGGGMSPLLWVAIIGGGAAAAYFLLKGAKAPIAGTISAPANGIQGAGVSVSSTGASDPSNGTLTFEWDCGGGTLTGTGATVTCTYGSTGTFTIKLKVKNAKKSSDAPAVSITIKSLTGTWKGTMTFLGTVLNTTTTITQTGSTLTGAYFDQTGDNTSISGTTTASAPHIRFTLDLFGATFSGEADAAGNVLTGTFNYPAAGTSNPWSMTRQ